MPVVVWCCHGNVIFVIIWRFASCSFFCTVLFYFCSVFSSIFSSISCGVCFCLFALVVRLRDFLVVCFEVVVWTWHFYAGFEVLTPMVMKNPIFWNRTQYSPTFRRNTSLYVQDRRKCSVSNQHEEGSMYVRTKELGATCDEFAQPANCFMPVSCWAYTTNLKTEAAYWSEKSVGRTTMYPASENISRVLFWFATVQWA
jgi:hypothetical protein